MKRYTVLIDWAGRADEFDTDEIVVYADTASAAAGKARRKWRATIGARWPHLRVAKARAYTAKQLCDLAR